jgi:large subunit ribosomal protein L25
MLHYRRAICTFTLFLPKNTFPDRSIMKQVALNVKSREAIGSSAAKRLRATGQIPAVIYGESGAHNLSVDADQFKLAWRKIAGSATLIELHLDGAEDTTFAIIKDYQRDPMRDNFEHIDFQEIVRGKDMEADIPVHSKGVANGVRNQQGVLEINAHELTVRCRPRDLPEFIEVDVTKLSVGDSLHVRDLPAIEGVTFVDDADLVVVSCVGSSSGASGASSDEEEEVATAEPAKA